MPSSCSGAQSCAHGARVFGVIRAVALDAVLFGEAQSNYRPQVRNSAELQKLVKADALANHQIDELTRHVDDFADLFAV